MHQQPSADLSEFKPYKPPSVASKLSYLLFQRKYHPIPSVWSSIILFLAIGAFYLILSIVLFADNNKVVEFSSASYEGTCKDYLHQSDPCTITISVTKGMAAPVYFLYELENYYQNHRRYLSSKSNKQLHGDQINQMEALRNCQPVVYNEDLYTQYAWDGVTKLDPKGIASPCGQIARSMFNDTYELYSPKGQLIQINQTGIAWEYDQAGKYRRTPNSRTTQWVDPQNQHFIVWMRTAGLKDFKKMWGRIEQDLPAGTYTLKIQNNFNIGAYGGSKKIFMTTASAFGGKVSLLPITCLVVSVISVIASATIYYKSRVTS